MSFLEGVDSIARTRIPIFVDKDQELRSENIPALIATTVQRAIVTAPILLVDPTKPIDTDERRETLFQDSDERGLISFRAPDDLHLIPLVEKEIFRQLMDLVIIDGKRVNARSLMCVDPGLEMFVEERFPDSNLYGETILEHEMRHVFGFGDYTRMRDISLRMVRLIFPSGKDVLTIEDVNTAGIMGKTGDLILSQLAGIFAPRHPSIDDIEVARELMRETMHGEEGLFVDSPQFLQINELIDTIIDDAERDQIIFEEWVSYRNLRQYFNINCSH